MSAGLDYDLSEVKMSFRKRDAAKADSEERISLADSFISFLSSCLGAGVLAMPISFAYAGAAQALAMLLLLGFLTYQSNHALLKVAQKVSGKSYADVAEKALGRGWAATAVTLLFLLNLLGSSISYLVVVHWALSATVGYIAAFSGAAAPQFMGLLISGRRLRLLAGVR
jgi:amino acid permease